MRNVSDTAAVADVPSRRFAPWSDRDLESYVVGELPADVVARLEADAAQRPPLAAHLAERRAEQSAFALAHPWRAPLPTAATPWWRTWLLPSRALPALLAGAALVVVVRGAAPHDVAVRGAAFLQGAQATLAVKRGERVFAWQPALRLRPHDSLQLAVDLPEPAHLSVALEPAAPTDPQVEPAFAFHDVPLPAGRSTLPNSLVLDAEPGDEELVVIANDAPRDVQGNGEHSHLQSRVIARFLLVKEPAPLAPGAPAAARDGR